MAEPDAAPAPPKGEAAPAPAAKAAEPAAEARKPETAPAAPGFGGRILPYVLVWIAMTYGRDMLAGPQQVEKASENAPSAARAPPVHHRDAVDEEFAEFASAEAAPVAAKPVEAAPAEAKPVEAVPAVPRSAATNVLVRLCTSWGTQRNYLQLRQFLEDAYPQITTIDAEQYPPPPIGLFAQQIAGMAQIATLALMIGGEGVFRLFGAPTPNWYGGFKENKMFAFGCVWMANNVAAGMVATGAFEIVVGDRTIYSKLETGRLPNAKDVIDGLRRVGLTTPLEAKYLGTAPRSEL